MSTNHKCVSAAIELDMDFGQVEVNEQSINNLVDSKAKYTKTFVSEEDGITKEERTLKCINGVHTNDESNTDNVGKYEEGTFGTRGECSVSLGRFLRNDSTYSTNFGYSNLIYATESQDGVGANHIVGYGNIIGAPYKWVNNKNKTGKQGYAYDEETYGDICADKIYDSRMGFVHGLNNTMLYADNSFISGYKNKILVHATKTEPDVYFVETNWPSLDGGSRNTAGPAKITVNCNSEIPVITVNHYSRTAYGTVSLLENNTYSVTDCLPLVGRPYELNITIDKENSTVSYCLTFDNGGIVRQGALEFISGADKPARIDTSATIGYQNTIRHHNVWAFGRGLNSTRDQQVLLGRFNDINDKDSIFVVACGEKDSGKNVLTIDKDGCVHGINGEFDTFKIKDLSGNASKLIIEELHTNNIVGTLNQLSVNYIDKVKRISAIDGYFDQIEIGKTPGGGNVLLYVKNGYIDTNAEFRSTNKIKTDSSVTANAFYATEKSVFGGVSAATIRASSISTKSEDNEAEFGNVEFGTSVVSALNVIDRTKNTIEYRIRPGFYSLVGSKMYYLHNYNGRGRIDLTNDKDMIALVQQNPDLEIANKRYVDTELKSKIDVNPGDSTGYPNYFYGISSSVGAPKRYPTQANYTSADFTQANRVVMTQNNGVIRGGTPLLDQDLTTKKYVDDSLSNYIKFTDIATKDTPGVVKVSGGGGCIVDANGYLYIPSASTKLIDAKSNGGNFITPLNLDYAVKKALTDPDPETKTSTSLVYANWTDEDREKARATLGLNNVLEAKLVTQTETSKSLTGVYGVDSTGKQVLQNVAYGGAQVAANRIPTYLADSAYIYNYDNKDSNQINGVLISGTPKKGCHVATKEYVDGMFKEIPSETIWNEEDDTYLIKWVLPEDVNLFMLTCYSDEGFETDSKIFEITSFYNAYLELLGIYYECSLPFDDEERCLTTLIGDSDYYHIASHSRLYAWRI